jgi:hypothetical protein
MAPLSSAGKRSMTLMRRSNSAGSQASVDDSDDDVYEVTGVPIGKRHQVDVPSLLPEAERRARSPGDREQVPCVPLCMPACALVQPVQREILPRETSCYPLSLISCDRKASTRVRARRALPIARAPLCAHLLLPLIESTI